MGSVDAHTGFFSTANLGVKFIVVFAIAYINGTFNLTWFDQQQQVQRIKFFAFYPVKKQQWFVERFKQIDVDIHYENLNDVWWENTAIPYHLYRKMMDGVIPGFSCDYRIWLAMASSKKVCVWQGNRAYYFQANLKRLDQIYFVSSPSQI